MKSKIAALLVAIAGMGCQESLALGPSCCPPGPEPVAEFFNVRLQHYFYTHADSDEAAGLDAGRQGSEWVRTGLNFGAYETPEASTPPPNPLSPFKRCDLEVVERRCMPVHRFYAPGPSSHFFTANAAEAGLLRQPGGEWVYEGIAFYVPVPDASGNCAAGLRPVRRFYNDRARVGDASHRFPTTESAARRMRDLGWIDEGIAFCGYDTFQGAIEHSGFKLNDVGRIRTESECRQALASFDSCLGFRNLPLPRFVYEAPPWGPNFVADAFMERTALGGQKPDFTVALVGGSPEAAARDTYVQLSPNDRPIGVHLSTQSRGSGPYTSIHASVGKIRSQRTPGEALFPWRPRYNTDYELRLSQNSNVKTLSAPPGGAAYGVASTELVDVTSGRSLLFNILLFGTLQPAEFVGLDANIGVPIVATVLGFPSRYATTRTGAFIAEIPNYFTGIGSSSMVTVDSAQFAAILERARTLDPFLSPRPGVWRRRDRNVVRRLWAGRDGDGIGPVTTKGPRAGGVLSPFLADQVHRIGTSKSRLCGR